MAKYFTFKYASTVLYGSSTAITAVDPVRGPSTGGNAFIIRGTGFDPQTCNSEFTGALDPLKWLDISAAGGSIATGVSHLVLTTGAVAGATAGIESVPDFYNCQGEARVVLPKVLIYPDAVVELFTFMLRIDANNYAKLSIQLGLTSDSLKLVCEVYRGGVQVDYYEAAWTVGLSVLKILRWSDKIFFIANSSVVYTSVHFTTTAAKYRMYAYNSASNYDIDDIVVEHFMYRPYAAWDDSPVHDTVIVSAYRMRGIVPPSVDNKEQSAAYSGLVDITVVTDSTVIDIDGYDYYYVDSLKVIDSTQFDVRMSFIDDAQIATPTGTKKGL